MEYWRFCGINKCQRSVQLHGYRNSIEWLYSDIKHYDHVRSICTDSYDKQHSYGVDLHDYKY